MRTFKSSFVRTLAGSLLALTAMAGTSSAIAATAGNQGGTVTCTAELTLPNGTKVTSTATCPANSGCGSKVITDKTGAVIGVAAICIKNALLAQFDLTDELGAVVESTN